MMRGKGVRVRGRVRRYICFTGSPNQNCRKHFGFVILRWHKITVGQMLPAGQFGQNNLCSPTQKQAAHTAHLQGLRGSQCQGLQPLCLSYRLSTDGGSQTAPPDQNPLCSLLSGGDCSISMRHCPGSLSFPHQTLMFICLFGLRVRGGSTLSGVNFLF